MGFADSDWEDTLPSYLLAEDKTRLKGMLSQFFVPDQKKDEIRYENFYLRIPQCAYFRQGDLLHSLPICDWDTSKQCYTTGFAPVVIISNSCDVYPKDENLLDKEALFAHLIPVKSFLTDLESNQYTPEKIESIYNNLKRQAYSNLFYLPPNHLDGQEHIVFFDKTYWHPSENLYGKMENIENERFLSLDQFGFYLFICKLSYHFCRVPEENERT